MNGWNHGDLELNDLGRLLMPTEAEKLVVSSTKEEKQTAISSCVSQLTNERPNDSHAQIVAI